MFLSSRQRNHVQGVRSIVSARRASHLSHSPSPFGKRNCWWSDLRIMVIFGESNGGLSSRQRDHVQGVRSIVSARRALHLPHFPSPFGKRNCWWSDLRITVVFGENNGAALSSRQRNRVQGVRSIVSACRASHLPHSPSPYGKRNGWWSDLRIMVLFGENNGGLSSRQRNRVQGVRSIVSARRALHLPHFPSPFGKRNCWWSDLRIMVFFGENNGALPSRQRDRVQGVRSIVSARRASHLPHSPSPFGKQGLRRNKSKLSLYGHPELAEGSPLGNVAKATHHVTAGDASYLLLASTSRRHSRYVSEELC